MKPALFNKVKEIVRIWGSANSENQNNIKISWTNLMIQEHIKLKFLVNLKKNLKNKQNNIII